MIRLKTQKNSKRQINKHSNAKKTTEKSVEMKKLKKEEEEEKKDSGKWNIMMTILKVKTLKSNFNSTLMSNPKFNINFIKPLKQIKLSGNYFDRKDKKENY